MSSHDKFSELSKHIASSEKLQYDLSVRNSLKNSFGMERHELRTKRRLFNDADKSMLKDAKRPAIASEVHYDFSLDHSSPEGSPQLPSNKAMKRVYNNRLDRRYIASTQNERSQKSSSSPSSKGLSSSHWSKIRFECVRRMRIADEDKDESMSNKAVQLFRVLNRREPQGMWSDMSTLAMDCHQNGETIEDTVANMLRMFIPN